MARQHNRFWFSLEHVIRQSILQVGVLRDLTYSARKLKVLDRSLESLSDILKQYHDATNNQWGD